MGAVDSIVGAGLGLIMGNVADKRQLEQQRKLNLMQQVGQEEIGTFNQGLALDQWNKTNYEAQTQHMRNAGLNVGLMYGGGGGGGQTAQAGQAQGISGAQAPSGGGEWAMGAGLGMQQALQEATKQNIEADTRKKNVDADKTAGVDTEKTKSETSLVNQQLQNAIVQQKNTEIQNEILEYEKGLKAIENNIANETQETIIEKAKQELDYLGETIKGQVTANKISARTADNLIAQSYQNTVEQQIRMSVMKAEKGNIEANTEVQKQQVKNLVQVVMNLGAEYSATKQGQERAWRQLSVQERELEVKKQLADFGTNEAAHVKQWTSIVTDVIESIGISKYLKGAGKTTVPQKDEQVRDRNGRTQPKGWTDELR